MANIGDFALGVTFDTKFTTVGTTGAPTTLAGSPVVSAYVDNSTTEITAGITLSVDFDSRTGMHNVRVVATSGNGYAAGGNYQLVITTGTVGGTSVVGYVVGEFSIEARSSLRPTTAGRTLDVSAGGEAGLDWANIGSPTTAQNLSATNIDVDQVVASVSGAVGSVTAAVTVGTINANVITATAINADAITAAKIADGAIDAATFAAGAINAAAIATDAITAGKIAADAIGASELAADAVAEIADQVWDEVLSGHLTSGTTGAALNGAGAAGDPWGTALPGAYGAGSAGFIVGTNLDAAVSTRLAPTVAGRTLDVTTTGGAGIDWANVENPTTTLGLSGTTIKAVTDDVGITQAGADKVWLTTVRSLTDKAGFALSSAGIQAIWDALTSALTTVGSIGKLLVDNINATISSRATPAQVNTEADTALADVGLTTTVTGRIDVAVSTRASQVSVDDLPTNAELATALGTADDAVLAAIATRASQTSVDDLPTNAELATALAAADDAVLAAIAAIPAGPSAVVIADTLLDRDMATGTDSGSSSVRTPRQALRFLRNKWSIAAGTLTVTKENDTTASWTAVLTTDAAAEPVTASDPAGP